MDAVEGNRFSEQYINFAQPRLGAKVLSVTDEFFGACERMLQPEPAIFIPGKFDDNGKWMDGWESRRKRTEGHDSCIVRLGVSGIIRGIDIDTSHFMGNQPLSAALEACYCAEGIPTDQTEWHTILPSVPLQQDSHHLHDIQDEQVYNHIRLHMYPDGGIARLRIYGEVQFDWDAQDADEIIDLFAIEHGGKAIACSNQAFGSSTLSLNLPNRGLNMGDGWETARRRQAGNEWVILALGHPGKLSAIEIDTAYYKGNYPDRIFIEGTLISDSANETATQINTAWQTILPEQHLRMDDIHLFEKSLQDIGTVSHVRVNIIPDGGLSRIRLYGKKSIE